MCIRDSFGAFPEEVQRCPGTTCVFHGPELPERSQDGDVLVVVSPICSYSRFMTSEHYWTLRGLWLAELRGELPAGFAIQEIRQEMPSGLALEDISQESGNELPWHDSDIEVAETQIKECVYCMHNKAAYRWDSCVHPHEGIELVCLFCRGLTWEALINTGYSIKRDMHNVQTPCPICRTQGYIVRHDGTKGRVAYRSVGIG